MKAKGKEHKLLIALGGVLKQGSLDYRIFGEVGGSFCRFQAISANFYS